MLTLFLLFISREYVEQIWKYFRIYWNITFLTLINFYYYTNGIIKILQTRWENFFSHWGRNTKFSRNVFNPIWKALGTFFSFDHRSCRRTTSSSNSSILPSGAVLENRKLDYLSELGNMEQRAGRVSPGGFYLAEDRFEGQSYMRKVMLVCCQEKQWGPSSSPTLLSGLWADIAIRDRDDDDSGEIKIGKRHRERRGPRMTKASARIVPTLRE